MANILEVFIQQTVSEGEHVSETWTEHVNGFRLKSLSPRQIAQIAFYAKSANKEPSSRTELVKFR
jgi:hypothetical protein